MAALPVLTSEASTTSHSGSLVALAAGLLAFTTGVVVLLNALLLPAPPSDTKAVQPPTVKRSPDVWHDAETGVPGIAEGLRLFATMTQPDTNNRSDPAETNDRGGVDQLEPGSLSSDLDLKVRHLRTCTSANPESNHQASKPLCSDARGALMEMAAARYRRAWTRQNGTDAATTPDARAVPATEAAPNAAEAALQVERVDLPQAGHVQQRSLRYRSPG